MHNVQFWSANIHVAAQHKHFLKVVKLNFWYSNVACDQSRMCVNMLKQASWSWFWTYESTQNEKLQSIILLLSVPAAISSHTYIVSMSNVNAILVDVYTQTMYRQLASSYLQSLRRLGTQTHSFQRRVQSELCWFLAMAPMHACPRKTASAKHPSKIYSSCHMCERVYQTLPSVGVRDWAVAFLPGQMLYWLHIVWLEKAMLQSESHVTQSQAVNKAICVFICFHVETCYSKPNLGLHRKFWSTIGTKALKPSKHLPCSRSTHAKSFRYVESRTNA